MGSTTPAAPAPRPAHGAGWLARLEEALAALLVGAILLITLYAVMMRYVFDSPEPWPMEASRQAMVLGTFVGAGVLAARREWIVVDLVSSRAPRGIVKWWDIALHLVTAGTLLIICWASRDLILHGTGTTPAMGIPRSLIYGSVTGALLLISFHELQHVWRELRGQAVAETGHVVPGVEA